MISIFEKVYNKIQIDESDENNDLSELKNVDEQEEIEENTFNNNDFVKHDYIYFLNVLNDITINKHLKLGKNGEKEIDISDEAAEEFSKLDRNNTTFEEFNKIASKYGFIWSNIYKGTYSGHKPSDGQSGGEKAEAVVSYLFNHVDFSKTNTISNKIRDFLKQNGITDDWIYSSIMSAKKIQEYYSNSDYIAAHVDGQDIDNINNDVKTIASIFTGKEGIRNVLRVKDKKAFEDLYVRNKNNWNKSDIVLIKKSNIKSFLKDFTTQKISISSSVNFFINEKVEQEIIIPISLKLIPKNITDTSDILFIKEKSLNEDQNISEDEEKITGVTSVDFIFPSREMNTTSLKGSCYLKANNNAKIQFRTSAENENNLSIETMLNGARGGKPLNIIKIDMNIKNNDYYSSFKSGEEFIKTIKSLYNDLNVPEIPSSLNNTNWYEKTCFKGIAGLLSIFKKINPDSSIVDFFVYVYKRASTGAGKSTFFLLRAKDKF